MRGKRRFSHGADWHAERLAEGPGGYIRERGVTSWEQFQLVMQQLMEKWEAWPEPVRVGYAFPNPEDRRSGKENDGAHPHQASS